MPATTSRLPNRFPTGTRFVVEGEDAGAGRMRIVTRYLVYPDGARIDLLGHVPRLFDRCDRKRVAARRRHAAQHREDRPALQ